VQIQLVDKPKASSEPYRFRPLLKIAQGLGITIAIGIMLCLFLEILSGKVRFLSDVEGDLGVPVIGVIPRK
jgi:capsular polysaccharide biosynthesis protein